MKLYLQNDGRDVKRTERGTAFNPCGVNRTGSKRLLAFSLPSRMILGHHVSPGQ